MSGTKAPRTLFITGGMSGLGRALAAAYLRRGADVAIFDLAANADVPVSYTHLTLPTSDLV